MAIDTAVYPGDFDLTKPPNSDPKSEGAANFRHVKTVLKTTFPNVTGAVTPTHTALNKVGVTQAQSSSDTSPASTAFVHTAVNAAAMSATTPTVIGDAGKFWGTDGVTPSWSTDLKATLFRLTDGTDTTKKLAFDASGVTTGTTRTLTIPDASGTIALLGNSASQAQMEEATNIYTFATPANVQWHPSAAKVWLKAAGDGTALTVSHNVTSITDTNTGRLTVTIASDFSSADYAIVATAHHNAGMYVNVGAVAAGSFEIQARDGAANLTDPSVSYFAACFGDLA
jgi:hypothetical protein